jgi:hypothetical protein
MGHTIWVDVEGRPDDDLPSDTSLMLRLEKHLDKLAGKLRVVKLSSFYDYSELGEYYGDITGDNVGSSASVDEEDNDDDSASNDRPRGSWFDPQPALAAVTAIRDHLSKHPDDLGFRPDSSTAHWPADLMDELRHCRAVLQDAAHCGRRFRFLIVA